MSDRFTFCPSCGSRIGWDGHEYAPCTRKPHTETTRWRVAQMATKTA